MIKKTLILLLFFIQIPLFCKEDSSTYTYLSTGAFSYMSLDEVMGGPTVGLGVRSRQGNFSMGVCANAAAYIVLPYFAGRAEGQYFLSQDYYTGIAAEVGCLYVPGFFGEEGSWVIMGHPEILFGKERRLDSGKTTFAQVGICPPLLAEGQWSRPSIMFHYGIGF